MRTCTTNWLPLGCAVQIYVAAQQQMREKLLYYSDHTRLCKLNRNVDGTLPCHLLHRYDVNLENL